MGNDEILRDEDMSRGFFLAVGILDSLGMKYDTAVLLERLQEVASGEASILNSEQEEIDLLEQKTGEPVTPKEREEFRMAFAQRADMDLANRQTAARICRAIQKDMQG